MPINLPAENLKSISKTHRTMLQGSNNFINQSIKQFQILERWFYSTKQKLA